MRRRSTCNRLPAAASKLTFTPQVTVSALINSALVPPRAGLEGRAAVERMADDFRRAGSREGGLTRGEMKLAGWTDQQIDTFSDAANVLAQSLSGASS